MAGAMKLLKLLKSTEKFKSSTSTRSGIVKPTETPNQTQSHKSQVLPKGIKKTGRKLKQLFKRSQKNAQSLYLRQNEAFCVNPNDDIAPADNEDCDIVANASQPTDNGETQITVGVTDGEIDEIGDHENFQSEEESCVENKVAPVAPKETEVDDVQECPHIPQFVGTIPHASNVNVPPSPSGISEVVAISPRSSLQLDLAPTLPPLDATNAGPIIGANETTRPSMHDVGTNTTPVIEECGIQFFELYNSYAPTPTALGNSGTLIENGYTSRADHTRTSSDATTLMATSSRDPPSLDYSADFQRQLEEQYQFVAEIQGQQDRRAVERDLAEEEDEALSLGNDGRDSKDGKQIVFRSQLQDYEALLLKAKQEGEEQVKTYEFLLTKAEQDSKDALAEKQDEYDDEVKDLKKDLEDASNELKAATKELESATNKNVVLERRLRKALGDQDSVKATQNALAKKCKALEDDSALKDEQLLCMSSTLQNRQEELEALSGRYDAARTTANNNAQLVEKNGPIILDLRQTVQILAGQLTQYQQGPAAALIERLQNENSRLWNVVAENHNLLGIATVRVSALAEALRQAKREHDRWFAEFPEHSLSNETKVANHLAYKDKLYEDLEKRFQAYTATNEEEQKKAREYKGEAEKYMNALKTAFEVQNQAVNKAKKDHADYRAGMSSILAATLGAMRQDDFIEGLSFHFNLVQSDNEVLATRVAKLDEEVGFLKQEVAERERQEESLVKKLKVQQETTQELEAAKRTAVGEIDALKYTIEVAEEGYMQQVKNHETCLAKLKFELKTMGDRFSAINHESASERIRFELNAKDNFIQALRDKLDQCNQAYVQACYDREHYKKASELDASLEYADNCNVSFLQRQLCLSEENYAKLQADLDDVHLRNSRDRRLSKEALDEEKGRVQDLEKQLHELYQNLQARASQAPADTPADTPPRLTNSKPAEYKSAAVEDLAGRLWSCLRGLEIAVGAHGFRVLDHDNEREAIRLACADLLGLEEDGSPRSATSVEDAGDEEDMGDNTPNPDSDDNLAEEGTTEQDQAAQLQGDYALAEGLINDACDALGYAPDDPFRAEEIQRSVYGRSREVEGGEGSGGVEIAPGLGSSTDAVVGEEDEQDGWEDVENPVRDASQEEASQSSTDEESSTTTTTDGTESGSGHDDDGRTVTQEQYNAAAVTSPQHAEASAESAEDTAGTSPTDEDDPDDSMEMTPGTWARRYAPPFMYGEPIEDDMF